MYLALDPQLPMSGPEQRGFRFPPAAPRQVRWALRGQMVRLETKEILVHLDHKVIGDRRASMELRALQVPTERVERMDLLVRKESRVIKVSKAFKGCPERQVLMAKTAWTATLAQRVIKATRATRALKASLVLMGLTVKTEILVLPACPASKGPRAIKVSLGLQESMVRTVRMEFLVHRGYRASRETEVFLDHLALTEKMEKKDRLDHKA